MNHQESGDLPCCSPQVRRQLAAYEELYINFPHEKLLAQTSADVASVDLHNESSMTAMLSGVRAQGIIGRDIVIHGYQEISCK